MHLPTLLHVGRYNLIITGQKENESKQSFPSFPGVVISRRVCCQERKWNEVVRKWMLIFVFLSLVSCHLDSLTIVSLAHILLLQLGFSAQSKKRQGWTVDRKEQEGGKSEEHDANGRQGSWENKRQSREENGGEQLYLPCEGSLCVVPIWLFPPSLHSAWQDMRGKGSVSWG